MAETKENIPMTIAQKLRHIQGKIKVPKAQYNAHGNYHYRSCEDILAAAKPLLQELQAHILFDDSIELIGERYYVKAIARFVADGGEVVTLAFAREPLIQKGMNEPQITGSASSYARKYALNGLLLIDDGRDPDASENAQEKLVKSITEQAFEIYCKKHEAPEGTTFDFERFKMIIIRTFKGLPTVFESVPKIVDQIKPADCVVPVKMAEEKADKTNSVKDKAAIESLGKEMVGQAYFDYTTQHKDEVDALEGLWEVDKNLFRNAVRKHLGTDWPTKDDSVREIVAAIELADVLKEAKSK